MKLRHIEQKVRGWLPEQPNKASISESKPNTAALTSKSLLRIGGIVLPIIGLGLVAFYTVEMFEFYYTHFQIFTLRWMLYFAYFAGIAAVIAGVKMRMRTSAVGVPEFKRANSVAGITLLSIASLGLVVVTEADLHLASTLTVFQFIRLSWWSNPGNYANILSILPLAGLLILLVGKTKQTKFRLSTKIALWILSLGVIALIMNVIIGVFGSVGLNAANGYVLLAPYTALYLIPVGILSLTSAWLFLLSTQSFQVGGSIGTQ